MISRKDLEKREYEYLSRYAAKSAETRGRITDEEKCSLRTDFQRDRDRIIHSKAFRRLMHKTQVFLAPEGDHFRTRLTHTIEVSQISRTVARGLALNEDLVEAIALGHDLGHTPFGHSGERVLNDIHEGGFQHNQQSLRVVDVLETSHGKRGMNLTYEVRNGILNHTGDGIPATLEGQIVKICDRVAYINHDIDDAVRSRIISERDLPRDCIEVLGNDHRTRIDTLVKDLIRSSDGKDMICQSIECLQSMNDLRSFMFKNVYYNSDVIKTEGIVKVKNIIESIYDYYIRHTDELPEELIVLSDEFGNEEIVKDYVAGMTDRYAMNLYTELFVPKAWK